MIMLDGKQLYTADEAAALLGISTMTLQARIRRGTMKAIIISGKQHITGDEVKAAAEQAREGKGTGKHGG